MDVLTALETEVTVLTPHTLTESRAGNRATHGTAYCYEQGCRCAECRARAAVIRARRRAYRRTYMAEYRVRNREKLRVRNREWMRAYRAAMGA